MEFDRSGGIEEADDRMCSAITSQFLRNTMHRILTPLEDEVMLMSLEPDISRSLIASTLSLTAGKKITEKDVDKLKRSSKKKLHESEELRAYFESQT